MSTVLHLAERTDWALARTTGTYRRSTRGLSVDDTGFVHASIATQLPSVVEAFYADLAADVLVLLVVDLDTLAEHGIEVRWESPDVGPELFPHLYGGFPVTAVRAALPIGWSDGRLVLPDLTGMDVATGPPTDV